MAGETERVNSYLATVNRLEPDIAEIDQDAALASIAISLRRIADGVDKLNREIRAEILPALGRLR